MTCVCDRLPPGRTCYYCQNPRSASGRESVISEGIERSVDQGAETMRRIALEREAAKLRKRKKR